MLYIDARVAIPENEIEWQAIRAQGSGGQNVNKVASAVHLRFDIHASSLPQAYKQRLLALRDRRISNAGVVVIKAQQYRTQEQNRDDALARLRELVLSVAQAPKVRRATQPTRGARQRRLEGKKRRGDLKRLRGRVYP